MTQINRVTFVWGGNLWDVIIRDGYTLFRDAYHLGGPWSDVHKALANKSIASEFRKALKKAQQELLDSLRS